MELMTSAISPSPLQSRRIEGTGLGPRASAPEPASPNSFGALLQQMADDGVGRLKQAEATAMAGLHDRASVQEVVEAVMAAEQTLQTAVSIRDKFVNAYNEVLRMPI